MARRHSTPSRQPLGTLCTRQRLLVGGEDRLVIVRLADVDWIAGARNYVILHVGQAVFSCRRTLRSIAAELDGRFLRIHRSTIVNLERVEEVRRTPIGGYEVTLRGGNRLRASRGYRGMLLGKLGRQSAAGW